MIGVSGRGLGEGGTSPKGRKWGKGVRKRMGPGQTVPGVVGAEREANLMRRAKDCRGGKGDWGVPPHSIRSFRKNYSTGGRTGSGRRGIKRAARKMQKKNVARDFCFVVKGGWFLGFFVGGKRVKGGGREK